MQQIELFGESLNIGFNIAVEIAYEEITGEIFDLENIKRTKNMVALLFAAIIVNNPQTAITVDDLYQRAKANDIIALRECVFAAMNDWIAVPEVMKEDVKEDAGEDDAKKN